MRRSAPGFLVASLIATISTPLLAQGFGGTVTDILVRGDSLLAQDRANEAIVQFQEARTLCATPAEVVASLQGEGRAHLAMKEYLPAAGLFEEAAQKYPDDPRVADMLYLAGMARREGGDMTAAVPLLQKALQSSPTGDLQPTLKFQLAQMLRMSGKPADAIPLVRDFETEFERNPIIPNAIYTLAISQHDAGDLEGAEKSYRHLIDAYPHSQAAAESFYDLGEVLSARGNRKESAEFFRRYANGNPSSPLSARAMERAADMTLFTYPKEAAIMYGVAQVKAQQNLVPPLPEMQISRWIKPKRFVAGLLGRPMVIAAAAGGALLLIGAIVWTVRRRRPAMAV
ncbi:MAG TPA: tetratricopeptide repeat protein [Patescibacteria group bacterium]|nr:tetratricopeptide repeat protein [Patescibacteria group bacterium]